MAEAHISNWVSSVSTVFPNDANPLGTLFGGKVLAMMDINSSISCRRFCRSSVVTASTEAVDFHAPIHVGEIIEVRSRVAYAGRSSMTVRCEVYGENPFTCERRLCTIGHLNFVAVDRLEHPIAVPELRVETSEEQAQYQEAKSLRLAAQQRRERFKAAVKKKL